ncbi:serine protease inhibitor 2.1-like [Leguminivora glycinivorella]|uniref:serine protease inhibitor 2.1-like n=1 Tax=Leguminivora glycinivorella TaxID=1035111 RepID=UPI00200C3035|nr:serine protease inhibitor 2.1-like [Leguminivora glycinivorella]
MKTIVFLLFVATSYAEEFSARSRNFSIELLHHTQKQTGGHVVISPFGIWTLMTGVALGATGNSFAELQRAFILPRSKKTVIAGYKELTKAVLNPSTNGVSLTSKNFVFIDDDFTLNPDFRKTISTDFDATIKVLDFKNPDLAAGKANNFIQNSGGRVSNVLTSDDFAESRMILTNVISFKGLWSSPFNASETTVENFYNENNEVVGQVNMMYQRAEFPFSNIVELKAFVVELPYGNDGKYSMLLILPHPRVKLDGVYRRLENVTLTEITKKLQSDMDEYGATDVDIKLPRFKISTNVVMNKPLNDMGVYDIFEPDAASFKRVTNENIYVSAIVHKADIEVTETGTVASASTSANFADRISTPLIRANKPFLYFIIEKTTTTVIFGGIYSKPTVY